MFHRTHRKNPQSIILLVFLFLLLPFSFHCIEKPLSPVLPSWSTELTVPIMDRTYTFGDIVKKDIARFDTTGAMILYKPIVKSDAFKETIPADVFEMPAPSGNTIDQQIGKIPVSLDQPPTISVGPSELGITPGNIPPLTPDPPAVAINQAFGDSTQYKWLVFASGQMTLTVKNNFQFNIQFVGNTVQLVNLDDTTQVVGSFTFSGPIAPGATQNSNSIQLNNERMYAGLKMKATLQISGWAGTTINSTDNITGGLVLTNALLQSALINTLSFGSSNIIDLPDSAVKFDDSIKVKIAKFQSGAMKIRIVNNAALSLTVEFKMDELIDNTSNKPYQLPGTSTTTGYVTIPPKDSLVTILDMSKVNFVSRGRIGVDTLVTQYLHFSLAIKTLVAQSGFVLVNTTDNVITGVEPVSSFVLQEVQGKVPPKYFNISKVIDAGIGDIGKNLTLTGFNSAIQLSAITFSSGLFPSDLYLKIYAIDEDGNKGTYVEIPAQTGGATIYHRITPGVEDTVSIIPTDVNILMNSFLATKNQLPAKFEIEGYVWIDPMDVYNSTNQTSIGSVKQNDSITVSLDYSIPVALGVKDGSLKDTSSFSQNNVDTSLVNSIENGKIFFDVENTFPLDISVKMNLLRPNSFDSSMADITSPPVLSLPQDTINYPSIRVSADTTTARSGVKSFTFIQLSSSDAVKLPDASFAAVDLGFFTGKNQGVVKEFYKTDKIRMKIYASIIFNVNIDKITKKK